MSHLALENLASPLRVDISSGVNWLDLVELCTLAALAIGSLDGVFGKLGAGWKQSALSLILARIGIRLLALARVVIKKVLDALNYLSLVVAGVTGNPFWDAVRDTFRLIQSQPVNGAMNAVTLQGFMFLARVVMSLLVVMAASIVAWHVSDLADADLALGTLLAIAFLGQYCDAMYNATIASFACVLMQRDADALAAPGSAASRRPRSDVELRAASFFGVVEKSARANTAKSV